MARLHQLVAIESALLMLLPAAYADTARKPASPSAVNSTLAQTGAAAMQSVLFSNLIGGAGVFRVQLGDGGERRKKGLAAAGEPDTWTFWASPAYSSFDNTIQPLTSKGSILVGLAGLEYNREDQTIMGVSMAVDRLDGTTTFNNGTLDGTGYTVAPYLMHYLTPSVVLNANAGWGNVKFNSKAAGISSSPSTSRSLVSLGLMKMDVKGKVFITTKATLNWFGNDTKSYAFSDGSTSAGVKSNLTQLILGGQVAYDMTPFTPFVGVYQYLNSQTSTVPSETPREYSSTTQGVLGLNVSKGAFYGSVGYYAERDRSQVRAYAGLRF